MTDLDNKPYRDVVISIDRQSGHAVSDSMGHYRLCDPAGGAATIVTRALGATPALRSVMIAYSGEQALDLQLARRGPCHAAPRLSPAELDAAQNLWMEKGPHSYTFVSTAASSWKQGPAWMITVRGDTVASAALLGAVPGAGPATPLSAFTNSLPGHLFQELRRRLIDSSITTTVTYDPLFGFPASIHESRNCVTDADIFFRIDSLKPIGP